MSKKTDQLKFMQAMFPNVKFVECKYIEEGQRIADDSKTIDHIADTSKKVSLTEQWKKGELKEGAYYVRNEYDIIFTAENYINYDCFNDTKTCDFYNVETDIKEVLAEVPDYLIWKNYVNGYCEEHEYNLQLIEENQKLKELLKEWIHYYPIVLYEHKDTLKTKDIIELYNRTREVLK